MDSSDAPASSSNSPRLNLIGHTSALFARRTPLSLLIFVAAILAGMVAFLITPKQYNPEITRPAFAVTFDYPGATTAQAIDSVVYEFFEKVEAVDGVDEVTVTVHDGAHVQATVIFTVGFDETAAELQLRSQLRQHAHLARGTLSPPTVQEINPETIPVLQIVLRDPAQPIDDVRAETVRLSREIAQVPGVSETDVVGGYAPALVVAYDPAALAAADSSVAALAETLRDGQTRQVTRAPGSGVRELKLVFDGAAPDPAAIGGLALAESVQVRDVATVYRGAPPERTYVRSGTASGTPAEAVMLAVSKREGASAPAVTGAVRKQIDAALAGDSFGSLTATVVRDTGATASAAVGGLARSLLTSVAIVSLVLALFLSRRSALLVLVTIPLTLLIVLVLGYLAGETINRITLFALILSLGLLVDAGIVVVENMDARLRERPGAARTGRADPSRIAAAVNEVGIGLLLSTVTSVIVFLPMYFISGMMGPYMGPIAFFVPAALIVAFVVAVGSNAVPRPTPSATARATAAPESGGGSGAGITDRALPRPPHRDPLPAEPSASGARKRARPLLTRAPVASAHARPLSDAPKGRP